MTSLSEYVGLLSVETGFLLILWTSEPLDGPVCGRFGGVWVIALTVGFLESVASFLR